ncbi:hypothetical protein TrVE_jg2232 [Triparma verrucosa]|uniref:Importin N-terminal domain-containing protein n=1 Tax=Triparma verrucosa TaxID=1606542 RepID=A0A9W7BJI6_9STRA|nr:hypothetical protein TrVE_jg2232 [Triparma verrucosa]
MSLEQVAAAVSIVFQGAANPNNTQQTQAEANQFLTQFQQSPSAWSICVSILQSSDAGITGFFASQTLRNKLKYDLNQLPGKESLEQLRQELMKMLLQFEMLKEGGSSLQIITQLSLCVAVLSIQLNWNTCIPDLMSSPGLSPRCLLLILKSISEESLRGSSSYKSSISSQFNLVADLCNSIIRSNDLDAPKAMDTLKSWVRYVDCGVQCMTVPGPSNTETLPNWLGNCLEILATPESGYFESAVDVVVEVLRKYESEDPRNVPLVMLLIPSLMSLTSPFTLHSHDEDKVLAYVRVFTEMGESFLSLLLDPKEMNQVMLVELVLKCASIPDKSTACITMNFWYRFVGGLEVLEPYDFRQQKVDYFYPLLMQLTDVCCSLLVLPEGVESKEDMDDDVKSNRSYTADTVEDCCRLLGGDAVIVQIGKRLQHICSSSSNPPWQQIEACLYAVKSISRYIPRSESAVIPHVMNMVNTFASNPTSQPSILRHTSASLIGSYSSWIGSNPTYLEPFFNYLLLNLRDPECSQASSAAVKHLCESCGPELSGPVVNLYDQLTGSGIEIQDELQILEGVCKLMSKMSYADAGLTLQRVMTPVGGQLEMAVGSGAGVTPKMVSGVVQRLTVICTHANPQRSSDQPNLVLSLMQQCWPMLTTFVERYGNDGNMSENISRLFKYALRNCKREFAPLLEPLMQLLAAVFDHTFQSPYLYCSAICITEFAGVQECSDKLYNLIVAQSQSVFKRFTNLEAFTNHPDVVEEYFYLLSRFIRYCPALLFKGGDLLCQTLKCAVVGLQVHHRDANKGVLSFLENSIEFGLSQSIGHEEREGLQNAIVNAGEDIVKGTLGALLGDTPLFFIDSGSASIAGVLYKLISLCPQLVVEWVKKTAKDCSTSLGPMAEGIEHEIIRILSQPPGQRNEFNRSIRKFNEKVWSARRQMSGTGRRS